MSPVSCNWCLSEEYNQSEDWHRDLLHLPSFSRPCHGFKNDVFINMMFRRIQDRCFHKYDVSTSSYPWKQRKSSTVNKQIMDNLKDNL